MQKRNKKGLVEIKLNNDRLQRESEENRRIAESHSFSASIVEHSQDAIIGKDLNGVILSWNQGAEAILGYRAAEMLGRSITVLIPENIRNAELTEVFNSIREGRDVKVFETQRLHKNGDILDVSLTLSPIRNDAGEVIGAATIARDITKEKRITRALDLERRKFRGLFDSFPIGIVLADVHGNLTEANYAFLSMLGYSANDLPLRWDQMSPPEWKERDAVRIQEIFKKGSILDYEREFFHKNGTRIPVLIGAAILQAETGECVASVLDLTERKKWEHTLEGQKEDLTRINADLQDFVYTVSHDLREPLRTIGGFVELFSKHFHGQVDEKGARWLSFIQNGVGRMEELMEDLLTFSKAGGEALDKTQVDCNQLLHEVMIALEAAILASHGEITVDTLPTITANKTQLFLVFENLLANALKFKKVAPKIHIKAQEYENEWVFSVADNGIGIDPKHSDKIFVIFQRLHKRGDYPGTGLGLALAKRIVERHQGKIWVESQLEKGSTFYFSIPINPKEE